MLLLYCWQQLLLVQLSSLLLMSQQLLFITAAAAAPAAATTHVTLQTQIAGSGSPNNPLVPSPGLAYPGSNSGGKPHHAAAPFTRSIVQDLTAQLQQQLAQHKITVLLVVSSNNGSGMRINWNSIGKTDSAMQQPSKVYFVSSFEGFQRQWHTYITLHGPADSRGATLPTAQAHHHHHHHYLHLRQQQQQQPQGGRWSAAHASSHVEANPWQQQQQHHRNGTAAVLVAVLVHAVEGKVGMQQLHLLEAISRRLRHSHALSLDYSTWSDKGDTLISFSPQGKPISAFFQSTSIFRDAFTKIYDQRHWGDQGGGSGDGSNLDNTAVMRQQLPALIAKYNISSMLDSSCGSMHWMPLVLQNVTSTSARESGIRPGFKFMGTDVVCSLIEQHKLRFANNTNMRFDCVDYANQPLPSGYDLVFSRDSLQHLPWHAAWMFLNNVKASKARYLLVGSYVTAADANAVDIKGGEYYAIDLTRPPFRLWRPIEVINEHTADGTLACCTQGC